MIWRSLAKLLLVVACFAALYAFQLAGLAWNSRAIWALVAAGGLLAGSVACFLKGGESLTASDLRRETLRQSEARKWSPADKAGAIGLVPNREGFGWLAGALFATLALLVVFGLPGALNRVSTYFYLLLLLPFACWSWWKFVGNIRCWLQFRGAQFLPAKHPGVIGGSLSGDIVVPRPLEVAGGIRLGLRCDRYGNAGTPKSPDIRFVRLWDCEQVVPREKLETGDGFLRFPVEILLPQGVQESNDADPQDGVSWLLTASVPVAGLDLELKFAVQVRDRRNLS